MTGSPPRMRGKRLFREPFKAEAGITPADAGKTRNRACTARQARDHPRGCGENDILPSTFKQSLGSPPRMRGKLSMCVASESAARITPADAGKTIYSIVKLNTLRDHPRGCGENSDKDLLNFFKSGSPPRMRGKLQSFSMFQVSYRITPADAGKTRIFRADQRRNQDHPRGCGENCPGVSVPAVGTGSPPRMRGKLVFASCYCNVTRITPADAGKTGRWSESENL